MVAGYDNVEYHDVDEVDGLAEAAFYGILATPTIVVCDAGGREIASWREGVPSKDDIEACLVS
ncbi:MAG: hypothetical protein M1335_04230 [Chloroflexi bacterium]|nr:hypothetical protein [Chloroflexota bacterium]